MLEFWAKAQKQEVSDPKHLNKSTTELRQTKKEPGQSSDFSPLT